MNDKVFRNYNFIIIISLVLFLILYTPFFYYGQDLWDGVLISNALESRDRTIYWNWFAESGWFLVPILYDVFFYLKLNYFFIIATILIFHVLTAFYLKKILEEVFNLDKYGALVGFLIFLLSPVWGVYVSTVFLMHSVTLFVAIYCVYNVMKKGLANSYGYQLLSLLSIQQASLPVLIFSIIFFNMVVKRRIRNDILNFLLYMSLISIWFFLSRYFFPAHGLYEGYNEIDFSNVTNVDFYLVFHQFLSVVYPFYYVAVFIFILFSRQKLNAFLLVVLVLFAIMPFVLVGKPAYPSHLFAIQGWDQRQAITLVPMVAFFFAFFYKVYSESKKTILRYFGILLLLFFVAYSTYILAKSLGFKYRSVIVQLSLLDSISKIKFDNYNCAVEVKFDEGGRFKDLSQYEYSYIGKLAHGPEFLLYPLGVNVPYFSEDIYRRKYIVPDDIKSCVVKYYFESNIAQLSFLDVYLKLNKHIYKMEKI